MEQRQVGLTALYDRFHCEAAPDDDVVRLRKIHVEIDEEIGRRTRWMRNGNWGSALTEAEVASAPLPGGGRLSWGMGFMRRGRGAVHD